MSVGYISALTKDSVLKKIVKQRLFVCDLKLESQGQNMRPNRLVGLLSYL